MDKILLADAINAAGIAALVLDGSDRILGCTDAAGRLLGYNPDQLIGLPITSFLPEYPENGIGLGQTQELTVQSPAGAPLSLDANIVRWTDPAGQNRTTVILREAAVEREVARITQNELIQSDNAIRGANIGVFEYDTATKSVSVSSIWRKMLELEPDETLDLQAEWRSRVHLDDLAEALRPVDLCAAGLAERASCEYRLHARDRTHWRWMRTDIAVARRDRDGKATLLVGAQTDVTDRKAMEEALRISAEQFRSAFENAPIGKAVVALDGSWLRVNPALCTLLGFSEDEFRRTNFQSLTFPDDLEADLSLLRQLVAGEIQSYTMEKRYIRANGAIMWGLLRVGMVRTAEGKPDHFIAQVIDITEQRRLDRLKSEFVAVVSHELRTPLTAILGALSLLTTYDDDTLPDEAQRLLFIAKTNGDRLHNLINDILDFQKFSAGQMPFSLERHAVATLVEDTLLANLALCDELCAKVGDA
jgi:PAS domain S-box-containing protein